MHERWSSIAFSALLGIGALMAAPVGALTVNAAALRPAVTLSGNGWKFILDPRVGEDEIVHTTVHNSLRQKSGKDFGTRHWSPTGAVCVPVTQASDTSDPVFADHTGHEQAFNRRHR